MDKIKIGRFELYSLMVLYMISNDKIRGYYLHQVKQDLFSVVILGYIGSLILLFLYWLLIKNMSYISFDKIIETLTGKYLGKILLLTYAVYFFYLASLDLKDISMVNKTYILDTTPVYIISGFIIISVFIGIKAGIEVLSRVSILLFGFMIFIFMIFSTLVLSTNKLDFTNFLPFFEVSKSTILTQSLYASYSIPFGEIFVLLILYAYLNKPKKLLKTSLLASVTSGVIIISITVYNIIILGTDAMEYTLSPAIRISKRIDIEEFMQRFDLITSMVLVMGSYIKQAILVFGASFCIRFALNINLKKIIPLVCITVFTISTFVYSEYIILVKYRFNFSHPYIQSTFEVFIPIILLILSFFIKPKKDDIPKLSNQPQIQVK